LGSVVEKVNFFNNRAYNEVWGLWTMQDSELHTLYQQASIHIGQLADDLAGMVKSTLPAPCHMVCDANTHAALGHKLKDFPTYIFETPPAATMENVQQLRRATMNAASLLAVGSGTLNDLCKYASFLDGKCYGVAATAPSMNGYVSANASIREGGYKKTLPAHAPKAVWCDVPTLTHAPERLIQAGIGDILCRSTVQLDWLLSHRLTESAYEDKYFAWLQPFEAKLLDSIRHTAGNLIEPLTHALLISGLAMREAGSSAPASQGEHMLAHLMEMLYSQAAQPYHGETIAVTSLAMARHQAKLLSRKEAPQLCYVKPEEFSDALPPHLIPQARMQYSRKFPHEDYVMRLNQSLQANWPALRACLRKVHLPPEELEAALQAAGCPTSPQQIGWPAEAFHQAFFAAALTRDRLTCLDLRE
jgi:glycerol-1-phosphate dehydrogenase [NAD(P)+]